MGLANLVPGISGGTMLLAVGIYPQFISGVADVSTFRFRPQVILMLACVGGAAAVGVAGGAGLVSGALERAPWAMYSLFIGLTLGGVPLLWRAVQPIDRTIVVSAAAAIVVMALLATGDAEQVGADGGGGGAGATLLLIIAGTAGGAAMILPGVSGAYLLLILGQYRTIIDAVAVAADGARPADITAAAASAGVLAPGAIGVAVGVIGVSKRGESAARAVRAGNARFPARPAAGGRTRPLALRRHRPAGVAVWCRRDARGGRLRALLGHLPPWQPMNRA